MKAYYHRSPKRRAYLRAYADKWWKAHPEKLAAKRARKHQRDKEKVSARSKKYRAKNLIKIRAARCEWQKKNWPHRQQYIRLYNIKNAARLKKRRKENYQRNRVAILLSQKLHRENLSPEDNALYRARRKLITAGAYQKNPHYYIAFQQKRRAQKKQTEVNPNGITEWMGRIKSAPAFQCYYCQRMTSTMDVNFDHVFPLSKRYPHRIENLCASCEACNFSKGSKLISVWRTKGQLLFEL